MPRTALVTGGASGLGAATAARLRAEGLAVTTLDVSASFVDRFGPFARATGDLWPAWAITGEPPSS